MEELYLTTIPCIPPGAICDIAFALEKKVLEGRNELGRIELEKGIEDWYKPQYFEINLRHHTNRYGVLRIESVWDEDASVTRVVGEYFGNKPEYESRYISMKNELIGILAQLKSFAEENCKKHEIRYIVMTFIIKYIKLRIY